MDYVPSAFAKKNHEAPLSPRCIPIQPQDTFNNFAGNAMNIVLIKKDVLDSKSTTMLSYGSTFAEFTYKYMVRGKAIALWASKMIERMPDSLIFANSTASIGDKRRILFELGERLFENFGNNNLPVKTIDEYNKELESMMTKLSAIDILPSGLILKEHQKIYSSSKAAPLHVDESHELPDDPIINHKLRARLEGAESDEQWCNLSSIVERSKHHAIHIRLSCTCGKDDRWQRGTWCQFVDLIRPRDESGEYSLLVLPLIGNDSSRSDKDKADAYFGVSLKLSNFTIPMEEDA